LQGFSENSGEDETMDTCIYYLRFKGPIHFGHEGIGLEEAEEYLPSDSLTSALINAFSILEGPDETAKMVDDLSGPAPSFILSSLFPYGPEREEHSRIVEAVVRPIVNPPVENRETLRKWSKDLKRLHYLHPQDFSRWIGTKPLGEGEINRMIQRSGSFAKGWWEEELRPRVAIDRESQNSSVWGQACIWFKNRETDSKGKIVCEGAGLYGLLCFSDEKWLDRLASAFKILGDSGLGGERTYGMGLFGFGGFIELPAHWKSLFESKTNRHVFLSVYYPAETEREELRNSLEAWDAVERRGFIVSGRNTMTIKRKRVRMIREGSVSRKNLTGTLVDVTPNNPEKLGITHKIYRSGLAFLLPGGGK